MDAQNSTQTIRIILEILYFLSGPLIAYFAFVGLRQLKIAKENARMSAMRESYRLAADQCSFFHHTVTPALHALNTSLEEKKIGFFEKCKIEIEGKTIKVNFPKDDQPSSLVPVAMELANAPEVRTHFIRQPRD